MEPWKTAISNSDEKSIWIRGQEISGLMAGSSFTDVIFLLHHGRAPSIDERRLLDAILIGVADHGPGSPSAAASRLVASANRQAPEAAVAAGVLAIGDMHAGAGPHACTDRVGSSFAVPEFVTSDAAARFVDETRKRKNDCRLRHEFTR